MNHSIVISAGRGMPFPCEGGMRSTLVALAVAFGLSSCSTIGNRPPPADFPKLNVTVNYVPWEKMYSVCSQYGIQPAACTEVNFKDNSCVVWVVPNDGLTKYTLEHELLHCQGWDHPGETTLRDMWERFKETK